MTKDSTTAAEAIAMLREIHEEYKDDDSAHGFISSNAAMAFVEAYESLEAKLKIAREALEGLAAQDSGEVGSTKKSDCMATIAQLTLSQLSL